MLSLWGKRRDSRAVDALHTGIVDASRRAELYGPGALPDTIEGRFEALVLHVLVVLRRLRQLPAPAEELSQDLVDAVFAHLEIALREMGVGDFGVPKRMKKLAGAFYDRTSHYDPFLDTHHADGIAGEIGTRLGIEPAAPLRDVARSLIACEARLRSVDLAGILAGPAFVALLRGDWPSARGRQS